MAHIPYGYQIRNGQAVIVEDQASQIRSLYHTFLRGLSISSAGKEAGIPLSRTAIGKILSNRVYLGDGYYPQIIEESLFDRVQAERTDRLSTIAAPRRSSAPPAVPVQTSFVLKRLPEKEGDPVSDAQSLYESIQAMQPPEGTGLPGDPTIPWKAALQGHAGISRTAAPQAQAMHPTRNTTVLPVNPALHASVQASPLLTPEERTGKTIRCIPAYTALHKPETLDEPPRLQRVAAYCRVSTDLEEQESSYEAQVRHYTEYIKANPAWELAGIYADEGISGTDTKKREEFNRMMDACMAGEIDLIITKSISRFARNTIDCLRSIRQLKAQQIAVYFEKENINTLDAKGEVLITIMASLAQQESQSISQNVKMGIHYQYQQGKVRINHSCFLGYTKDASGNLVIVPDEAEIVRRIFREFLAGKSTRKIALDLTRDGVPTATGRGKWYDSTIRSMLRNEKYMGDALLQKFYTVDFLTKKKARNLGELPQYYVENNHEPIISREIYQQAQGELLRREHLYSASGMREVHSCKYALSGHMVCGICGSSYRRMRSKIPTQNTIWRCKMHLTKSTACEGRSVPEKEVQTAVLQALNSLASDHDYFLQRRDTIHEQIQNTLQTEINRISYLIHAIQEQISGCGVQLEMKKDDPDLKNRMQDLSLQLGGLQSYKRRLSEQKASLAYEERQLTNILDFINSRKMSGTFTPERTFREEEIMLLLDQVRVIENGYVVSFKVGRVIEVLAV